MLTFFGSPAVAFAIATVVCVLLYRRRHLVEAALLPVVLGGAELLNLILKLSFHRTRPEVGFVRLDTYSFPSGHAMMSTAAYGALAYLAWSHLRTRRRRVLLIAGTVVLVALICFSRLYLGVHYLSDVLAGVAGGGFLARGLHSSPNELRRVVRCSLYRLSGRSPRSSGHSQLANQLPSNLVWVREPGSARDMRSYFAEGCDRPAPRTRHQM